MCQVVTGVAPLGGTIISPGINMSNSINGTSEVQGLDIDCDGFDDLEIELQMGNLVIDLPNVLGINLLNQQVTTCTSEGNFGPSVLFCNQYGLGQTITCVGDSSWTNDTSYGIAVLGLLAHGPSSINNTFITFKLGTDIGWLELSYNLNGSPVTATIHEMVTFCPNSVDPSVQNSETNDLQSDVFVFPDPINGSTTVDLKSNYRSIRANVYDVSGQLISSNKHENVNRFSIGLENAFEMYFLELIADDHERATFKFLAP